MPNQSDHGHAFAKAHINGQPLVLYNIWDAGSAVAVAATGAPALATGSQGVALAHGYRDGEDLPLDLAMANLARIVRAVDVTVTVDLEAGYGTSPDGVAATTRLAIAAGAIGCNFEDRIIGGSGLHDVATQAARIAAMRAAADASGVPFFINARTDMFIQAPPATHDPAMVQAATERAKAYAEAGADGFFVPKLMDAGLIGAMVAACPLPLNIMVTPGVPSVAALAALGVARVSYGGGGYALAMAALAEAARAVTGTGA